MKTKRADRADWQRITKKRFILTQGEENTFRGYITLFAIEGVRQPLWRKRVGKLICLADEGYTWLQHFPQEARYALTSIFDAQGELVEWYIDICKRHYLNEKNELYYEDLYLDLVLSPEGELELIDVDELDEALHTGEVNSLEYELAWREASSLMTAIEEDMFPLLWHCQTDRTHLLDQLSSR